MNSRHRPARVLALALLIALPAGCRWAQEGPAPGQGSSNPEDQPLMTPPEDVPQATGWRMTVVAEGLEHPWGLAFLPDGSALITERPGRLRRLRDGRLDDAPIEGAPEVFAEGQGGLLDVAIHPRFEETGLVYLTYAAGTYEQNRTTLARARLDGAQLVDLRVLFEARPSKSEGQHFGSRILWLPDGTMLMSVGDGGNPPLEVDGILAREHAQRLDTHLGSVIRLNDDGSIPDDNPFVGQADATPELWAYGVRNIQGMALDPSGNVWTNEHGPSGGDELNLLQRGENHGWPKATFGVDYRTGQPFTPHQTLPNTVTPVVVWTPAQAPSGLVFYTGDQFSEWRGSLLSGGLVGQQIRRVILDGERAVGEESIPIGSRVRDVVQGPDGLIYVLTDEEDGELLRIEPERG
ncbi:MAG: PQQ-dependent sugar dehydrogenase [Enhygromyxa sp.]